MGYYLAIDPGKQGGVAVLYGGDRIIFLEKMPLTSGGDMDAATLRRWFEEFDYASFFMEAPKAWTFTTDKRTGVKRRQGVASTAVSHKNWGIIYGLVMGLTSDAPTVLEPKTWQIVTRSFPGRDAKERSAAAAIHFYGEKLFKPGRCTTIQDGLTDAVMMARFGWSIRKDTNE